MHVLQAAVFVVASCVQAQQGLHFFVPQRGDVVGFDFAFDQRALDFVAQDDVCRVGHFISVDADQARLHAREQAMKIVGFERGLAAEVFVQQGR